MRIPECRACLKGAAVLATLLTWSAAEATEGYFTRDIDYWNTGDSPGQRAPGETEQKPEATPSHFSGSTLIRDGDRKPFSWKDVLDPRNPAFWDDGGTHIPPRPFREAMVNPSPENIRLYQQWIEKKSALLARFDEAIEKDTLQKAARGLDLSTIEAFYVFSDSCPACQKDAPTVASLTRLGLRVRPIHLEGTPSALHPDASGPASLPAHAPAPNVTPTWVFQTPQGLRVLEGARSPLSLITSLASPLNERRH
jgi:hypothetical protein